MTYNNFSSLLSKTHEGHIFHRDHQKLYISQGFIRDSLKPISYRSDNSFKGSNKWRKSPVTTTPWSIGICLRDILSFIVWLITILSFFNYRLTAYNLQIYISSPFNLQLLTGYNLWSESLISSLCQFSRFIGLWLKMFLGFTVDSIITNGLRVLLLHIWFTNQ